MHWFESCQHNIGIGGHLLGLVILEVPWVLALYCLQSSCSTCVHSLSQDGEDAAYLIINMFTAAVYVCLSGA